ncbi:hypothetical protein N825_05675 [Skermanella stibiiresistens SB22]|uniref:Tetratricopeptide repeat protein n=1 Tax=Skermanella stibiiresistens SB22 TaxID=1385369 RepID=W9H0I4_9PROT|nr:tetratricopeptide repeat protein [Skermanella stibiiresistens]EWY39579.1 hypothetical protein N825_05675 [Skermanella stibiiresistens SB22]
MRQIEFRIPDGRMAFGDVPEHIDARLQEAVTARLAGDLETAERLLWEAHHLGPKILPVYYALYKFYFNQRRLDDAERVTLIGLEAAARLGGFDPDWRRLDRAAADWTSVVGPQHFYLFTLKALAFITLRGTRTDASLTMLAKLRELDPTDTVGYGVIATLAESVARTD